MEFVDDVEGPLDEYHREKGGKVFVVVCHMHRFAVLSTWPELHDAEQWRSAPAGEMPSHLQRNVFQPSSGR